jgi:hypothetical protein
MLDAAMGDDVLGLRADGAFRLGVVIFSHQEARASSSSSFPQGIQISTALG